MLNIFFPQFSTDMSLDKRVESVNNIRLGFLDLLRESEIHGHVTAVNTHLSTILDDLSDEEGVQLMTILSQAYAFVKVNLEHKRKLRIKELVNLRETDKLKAAEAYRNGQKITKEAKASKSANSTRIEYSDDPAENKAIKTMVDATKLPASQVVAMLKGMGALREDFEL